MIFPEEGTKAEFKAVVLYYMIRNTCADCRCMFIPTADDMFDVRCPECEYKRTHHIYYMDIVYKPKPSIVMMGTYT